MLVYNDDECMSLSPEDCLHYLCRTKACHLLTCQYENPNENNKLSTLHYCFNNDTFHRIAALTFCESNHCTNYYISLFIIKKINVFSLKVFNSSNDNQRKYHYESCPSYESSVSMKVLVIFGLLLLLILTIWGTSIIYYRYGVSFFQILIINYSFLFISSKIGEQK